MRLFSVNFKHRGKQFELRKVAFFDLLGFWKRACALSFAKFLFHLLSSFAVSSHEQRKVWNWKKKLFHTTFQSTTNFRFSLAKNLPGREPLLKKKNWKVYITQWISVWTLLLAASWSVIILLGHHFTLCRTAHLHNQVLQRYKSKQLLRNSHSGWKSQKKSHSTLRAKREMITIWVDKSSSKMPKMVNFGDF